MFIFVANIEVQGYYKRSYIQHHLRQIRRWHNCSFCIYHYLDIVVL